MFGLNKVRICTITAAKYTSKQININCHYITFKHTVGPQFEEVLGNNQLTVRKYD